MPTFPTWMVPVSLAAAMLAALGGIWLVGWGLWGDRNSKRRRCPRCWHDLSMTPGLVCGECGFSARGDADLYRRRRRWSHAVLGLVLILIGVGSLQSLGAGRDLWTLVPDRVLIAMLPWSGGPSGPNSLHGELSRRLNRGQIGDGSIEAVVEAIVDGDEAARPPSVEWRSKYASLLTPALVTAIEDRSDLTDRLAALPPHIEFMLASPWPEDLPAYGTIELQHWWVTPVQLRLTIDLPEHPEVGRVVVGYDSRGRAWRRGWPRFPVEFDRPWPNEIGSEVATRVQIDRRVPVVSAEARLEEFEVETGASDEGLLPLEWGSWIAGELPSLEQVAVLELGPPLAEGLTPVDGPAIRAAIADAFSPGLVVRDGGPRPYAIRFDVSRTAIPELENTALGLEMEVRERGEVRRRTWIWWLAGPQGGPAEWRISQEDAQGLAAATDHEPEEGRWTLAIRGDRGLAARAIDAAEDAAGRGRAAESYWAGSMEIPLRVRRIPGAFSPRPWFDPQAEGPGTAPSNIPPPKETSP